MAYFRRFAPTESAPNAGKPWATEEENKLLDEVKQPDITLEQIGSDHGRTIGSISARLKVVAFEMIDKQGQTVDQVVERLRFLEKKDLETYLSKKQANQERKAMKAEKKNREAEKKTGKSEERFEILWKFKLFMKSKFDFDEETHNMFDEFVEMYEKSKE